MHGVTQRTRVIRKSEYKREVAKTNIGENIAHHMTYIYAIVLYDKMGMTFKKLDNCYTRLYGLKVQWQDDSNTEVTSKSLLKYAAKKKIDVTGFVKSIPTSEKLYLADMKNRGTVDCVDAVNYGLLATLLLIIPVLKEHYRYSNAKIEEFFQYVSYAIKMYSTKLPKEKGNVFDDEYIRKCFIEDEGFDMKLGDYVNKDEVTR